MRSRFKVLNANEKAAKKASSCLQEIRRVSADAKRAYTQWVDTEARLLSITGSMAEAIKRQREQTPEQQKREQLRS